jgi:hypothetical protein
VTDAYVLEPDASQPSPSQDAIRRRVAAELAAEPRLDPLDEWPEAALLRLWAQDGRRLEQRELAVQGLAEVRGWSFVPLDPGLTGWLDTVRLTDATPRVARNVCRDPSDRPTMCDLTGLRVDLDDDPTFERRVRLCAATMVLVPYEAAHGNEITVSRRHWQGWRPDPAGLPQSTDTPAFDQAFSVRAHDAGWARLFLTMSTMDRLLRSGPVTLHVRAGWLALHAPGLVPTDAAARMVDTAVEIAYSARAAADDSSR